MKHPLWGHLFHFGNWVLSSCSSTVFLSQLLLFSLRYRCGDCTVYSLQTFILWWRAAWGVRSSLRRTAAFQHPHPLIWGNPAVEFTPKLVGRCGGADTVSGITTHALNSSYNTHCLVQSSNASTKMLRCHMSPLVPIHTHIKKLSGQWFTFPNHPIKKWPTFAFDTKSATLKIVEGTSQGIMTW